MPAPARAAEAFVGVDTAGQLVTFGSERVRLRRRALSGVPSGETILGLDIRPANRQLYALSSASRLYTIDVGTATATAVGTAAFTPALDGGSFGFDFNPVVDRIDVGRNTLVLQNPPNPGTLATVGALGVNATSPVGFDITPANGTAYATFRAAGTRGSVLYRIDLTNGRATALGNLGGASLRAMAVRGTLP